MGRDARRRRAARQIRQKAAHLHETAARVVELKRRLEGGHDGLAEDLTELERLRARVPQLEATIAEYRGQIEEAEGELEEATAELATARAESDEWKKRAELFEERARDLADSWNRMYAQRAELHCDLIQAQDLADRWMRLLAIAERLNGEVTIDSQGGVLVDTGRAVLALSLDEAEAIIPQQAMEG